ncbi:hypothetical protein [Endozoicomonas sp.]|uniref:hypothetical protein n=1 Tax=Endozoicomonas sp. TaxID=1892382 RepID=UPI003AF66F55
MPFINVNNHASLNRAKVKAPSYKSTASSWGRSVKKWVSKKAIAIDGWLKPDGRSISKRRVIALTAMCLGGGLILGAGITALATFSGGTPLVVPVVIAVGGGLILGGYGVGRRS